MPGVVHYIPILTTFVAIAFAPVVYRRWQRRRPWDWPSNSTPNDFQRPLQQALRQTFEKTARTDGLFRTLAVQQTVQHRVHFRILILLCHVAAPLAGFVSWPLTQNSAHSPARLSLYNQLLWVRFESFPNVGDRPPDLPSIEEALRGMLTSLEAVYPVGHPESANRGVQLARVVADQGRSEEADSLITDVQRQSLVSLSESGGDQANESYRRVLADWGRLRAEFTGWTKPSKPSRRRRTSSNLMGRRTTSRGLERARAS